MYVKNYFQQKEVYVLYLKPQKRFSTELSKKASQTCSIGSQQSKTIVPCTCLLKQAPSRYCTWIE